jgi:hypothetical protein
VVRLRRAKEGVDDWDKPAPFCVGAAARRSTSSLDPDMRSFLPIAFLVAVACPAFGTDTVVIGRGISNTFAFKMSCPPDLVCLDAMYQWVIDVKRTVAGPAVKGHVTALVAQHVDATPQIVESTRLFVLRPIQDLPVPDTFGANFYLLAVSPRDNMGRYCLSVNPRDVGLKIDRSRVNIDSNSGNFCFDAVLLR